jgi:4-aminobutyrate aminotransferase-like enzyme
VFVSAVYDLCKKYNILFIADEVRQGAGKTGKFFGYENLGPDVKPDLVAMGKSIAVCMNLSLSAFPHFSQSLDHIA